MDSFSDGSDEYWVKLLQDSLTHRIAQGVQVARIRVCPDVCQAILRHYGPSLAFSGFDQVETFWGYNLNVDSNVPDAEGFVLELESPLIRNAPWNPSPLPGCPTPTRSYQSWSGIL